MFDLNDIKAYTFSEDLKSFPSGKVLAAIAVLGKTQWIGNNNRKTHPRMVQKFKNGEENSCCHAEVSAIAKVPRQSRHLLSLYVIRFLKNGEVSMAKPCELCQKYLSENGINFKNVYYTDWNWNGEWKRLSNE